MRQALLDAFRAQYAVKYEVGDFLGAGANGFTHAGRDLITKRDVALKFSTRGIDVAGQEDMALPATLRSRRLAEVYTVEPYEVDGRRRYVVVSRRIVGMTLSDFHARCNELLLQTQERADADAIAGFVADARLQVAQELGYAVDELHNLGVAHGDLHAKNVLVEFPDGEHNLALRVALIDLGSSSLVGDWDNGVATAPEFARDMQSLRRHAAVLSAGSEQQDLLAAMLAAALNANEASLVLNHVNHVFEGLHRGQLQSLDQEAADRLVASLRNAFPTPSTIMDVTERWLVEVSRGASGPAALIARAMERNPGPSDGMPKFMSWLTPASQLSYKNARDQFIIRWGRSLASAARPPVEKLER